MPRLRRADCAAPGFTRRRRGRGFTYFREDGRPLRDVEALDRIRMLAIPPAWTDVWICPDPIGHLQAVGIDAAGRRQYLYHPRWRALRDRQKFERMIEFARQLPRVRRTLARRLCTDGLTRDRVLSCAVALLDQGLFRIGSEEYAGQNGSYGLATLQQRHVSVDGGDSVVFDFVAKTGKRLVVGVDDASLHAVAAELLKVSRPGSEFLAYEDGGAWVDVRASDINDYVKELTRDDFSAKDFRTWHANVLAAKALATAGPPLTPTGRKREVAAAIRGVADALGNTPAVCRASYVDPRLFDHYRSGSTIPPGLPRAASEQAVVELLGSDRG